MDIKKIITIFFSLALTTILLAQKEDELYNKSVKLSDDNKYKQSLNLINKAIKINDKRSDFFIHKAEVAYALNNDLEEFFILLNQGVNTEPNSPSPLLARAFYFEKINKYQDAILDYNDALKLTKVDSVIQTI